MKRFPIAFLTIMLVSCAGGNRADRTVLQNKGSDTLVNVAQAWAEAYSTVNPDVAIAVTGGGSGTGISAMINGTVDIANSSRRMRESEIELARANGQDPIEFVVGYDAVAVFIHAENPIDTLTTAQLAAVYGEGGAVDSWSQLGVRVPGCPSDEIVRVSRQNNSGTYAYFRAAMLDDADYKLGSLDMHGSKDVVELVQNTPCAIGYSGLAYATPEVKMPCVALEDGADCVAPSVESAVDLTYPIARPLFMYTAGLPEGAVEQFLDWVLSDAGQCIIVEKGYASVRAVACA